MRRALAALTLALVSATARAESFAPPPVRSIDLLIVVDTSPGAAPLRASFTAALPAFVDALEQQVGGTTASGIDLRVGVITADPADAGALRTAKAADCAAAPDDAWVSYTAQSGGLDAHANFHAGTVADAIACLVPGPSVTGADDIQAFTNVERVIEPGASFERPGATHAFLVVTTREDCSASSPIVGAFACAQAAWSCTPTLDATTGARQCIAQAQPTSLEAPSLFVDSLWSIDSSPDLIAFGAVRAPEGPITVTDGPALAPSCTQGALQATPALRVDAIAASFTHGWTADACAIDLRPFASVITAAVWQPVLSDDYHGDCDGGIPRPVDPPDQHPLTGCVGCSSQAPDGGAALAFAIAALAWLRRSSPSRRCRG